jgi:glycosyltransferase involved in cell wall biosynthesis
MSGMRLALVADGSNADVQKLARAVTAAGHEVMIFSLLRPRETTSIPVRVLPRGRLPLKAAYIAAAPWLRRELQRFGPDLVHAFFATGCGFMSTLAGIRPLVVSTAGSDILVSPEKSRTMRLMLRAVFAQASLVTALAPHMAEAIRAVGCAPEKIWTLPFLGINPANFLPHQPTGTTIEMVCTRGIHQRYRHDLILAGARQLMQQRSDFRLRFYGHGTYEAELQALANELGLSGVVSFPGRVAPAEIPQVLAGADVYVSMCPNDGVSSSLLEAMAAGTFPIVTDNAANRWWIEDGVNGLLVPLEDPAALAAALHRAASDTELRASAARHNREVVCQRADLKANIAQLVGQYAKVVQAGG